MGNRENVSRIISPKDTMLDKGQEEKYFKVGEGDIIRETFSLLPMYDFHLQNQPFLAACQADEGCGAGAKTTSTRNGNSAATAGWATAAPSLHRAGIGSADLAQMRRPTHWAAAARRHQINQFRPLSRLATNRSRHCHYD